MRHSLLEVTEKSSSCISALRCATTFLFRICHLFGILYQDFLLYYNILVQMTMLLTSSSLKTWPGFQFNTYYCQLLASISHKPGGCKSQKSRNWNIKQCLSNIPCSHIDGLVKERCNSIANALELRFLALTHRYISFGRHWPLCVTLSNANGYMTGQLYMIFYIHVYWYADFFATFIKQESPQWVSARKT